MKSLKNLRAAMVNRLLGIDVAGTLAGLQDSLDRQESRLASFREQLDMQTHWHVEAGDNLSRLRIQADAQIAERKVRIDNIPELAKKLAAVRSTKEYEGYFADKRPLVTVRIATYNKTDQLVDVALKSIFDQTYDNFNVVVVNDGPNARTREAIGKLGDKRVRFEELPERGKYPEYAWERWMVAGTDPANRASELADGVWIAPLDDDDEFTPDHIEKLVELALREKAELAYGALTQKNVVNGDSKRIWSFPPAISNFSFQGSIYLRALNFFQYEPLAWTVNEPGDWNLIRRMSEAGVRMAATEDIVAVMNHVPYTHKSEFAPEH